MFHDFELPFLPFVMSVFGVLLLFAVLTCVSFDGAAEIPNQWTGFQGEASIELRRAEIEYLDTSHSSSRPD